MRAVFCRSYGPPEMLEVREVETPTPKEKEILINIRAFPVTLPDVAFRKGDPFIARLFTGLSKPKHIPGDSIAGVVTAVGKDIADFKVGDEVFGSTGPKFGAAAEFKALPETEAITIKPSAMSFEEAAGFTYEALTALPFIRDIAAVKPGLHILINGASASIGICAVQLAKYYGAKVTGVCSTTKVELVKSLGADEVIDYTEEDFTKNGVQYDVIFDAVGKRNFNQCKASLKENGKYITTVMSTAIMQQMLTTSFGKGKKAVFSATGLRSAEKKLEDLKFLRGLVEEGKLRTVIDTVYTIDNVVEAHHKVETEHKTGNIIISLTSE